MKRGRSIALALALAAATASPALPQNQQPRVGIVSAFNPSFVTYRSEERVERPSLGYWVDAAVAENGLARFVCDGPSSVTIQLWLERDQIDAWFTQDRAGWVAADLVTDSTRTPFAIEAMTYDWLVGFWIPELAMLSAGPTPFPSASATAEWLRAFTEATTISVSTPAFDILLTPAEGDPENRAAFVEACMAM